MEVSWHPFACGVQAVATVEFDFVLRVFILGGWLGMAVGSSFFFDSLGVGVEVHSVPTAVP